MILSEARALVLYPWTGLPALDRGSARRVVPMAEMLAEQARSVEVLFPGPGETREKGVLYKGFSPSPWEKSLLALAWRFYDGATHHAFRGRVAVRERRQWWHFLQPAMQFSLRRSLRKALASCDVVFLEYPFWSSIMERFRLPPVVLTMHDLLSDVVSQPWLRQRIESRELAACRSAEAVVCVSRQDEIRLRDAGIEATFIPHGLDLEPVAAPSRGSLPPGAEKAREVAGRGGMVCLFVGSSLVPNRDAVEEIRRMAARLESEPGIYFLIAGACCGPGELGPNISALGPLAEDHLGAVYDLSAVALAPLASGSGASLKVLEALARRKVLVSTSLGVRSHGLVSGREAILCDDPASYPDILLALKNDPFTRARLAEAGWHFIQDFDCRRVYRKYGDLAARLLASS